MIVLDGYTEQHEHDGATVLVRPFTRHDRKAIGEYLHGLSDAMAYRAERELALSRIVDCDRDVEDIYDEWLWELAMGINNTEQEIEDEENLRRGVSLLARFPWMARTSCQQCRQWFWNPLNGQTHRQTADGPALRRSPGGALLCDVPSGEFDTGTACPRGHWSNPVGLSPKNAMALRHYQACEATGTFPDDPIVRRNARVIYAAQSAGANQAADERAGGRSSPAVQLRRTQEHRRGPRGSRGAGRTRGRVAGSAGRSAAGVATGTGTGGS